MVALKHLATKATKGPKYVRKLDIYFEIHIYIHMFRCGWLRVCTLVALDASTMSLVALI